MKYSCNIYHNHDFTRGTLPMGATLILIIFGIDETHLTSHGRMTAHPLYLTIGNILKRLRRTYSQNAFVVVAYLPVLKYIGYESDKAKFTEAKRKLYQNCVKMILDPLRHVTIRYL